MSADATESPTFAQIALTVLVVVPWLMGMVLARGWGAVFSVFPPYAWYILTEHLMNRVGC